MPFFPPTEASAIASRVVGAFIKWMPLLNVLAINPPKSQTMPPPKQISKEFLSALLSSKKFQQVSAVSRVLYFSPPGIENTIVLFRTLFSFKNKGRQCFCVFLSHKIKMFEKECSFRNCLR